MLYVLGWLLCGLVAAYIYREHKHRSWLMGLLAGLLLGPIGVLLALLTTTRRE